jgi:ribosome biogenesis protein BRX1
MLDLRSMMPHSRKEQKLDAKDRLNTANEIAELHSCEGCLLFEARKRQDLYLWTARTPQGPSIRFQVENVHTMGELSLLGNALRGSRPLLVFDPNFDAAGADHLQLIRSLLAQVFGVPRGHKKSQPFVDRVLAFLLTSDGRIWVRHYQILPALLRERADRVSRMLLSPVEKEPQPQQEMGSFSSEDLRSLSEALVEIGPRFVLLPIRIFAGSFGGKTLWENPDYISPNMLRRASRLRGTVAVAAKRRAKRARREAQLAETIASLPVDELADVFETGAIEPA